MQVFVETKRFVLREMLEEDAQGLFIMDSDPEVHKYLGNNPVREIEECQDVVKLVRRQYQDNGIGRWSIIDKITEEFIGWAGLKLNTEMRNGMINFYDIGYRLQRQHWGKGIATECALSCRDYAFEVLNLDCLYAAAHAENLASNKVLQKIGMTSDGTYLEHEERWNWYKMENMMKQ